MADQTMIVVTGVKAGVRVDNHANVLHGNAAGADYFLMPNNGKTVLLVDSATGDTYTFTAIACSHGRTETLAVVVAASCSEAIGPFDPSMWNDANGCVKFKPTVGQVLDHLLAVSIG